MIITDTSAILASIDTSAAAHAQCVKVITESHEPLILSHMVVAETDYLLTTRFGVATANRFLSDVASGAYRLAPSNELDIAMAITINTRYSDHALGVTDCIVPRVGFAFARFGESRAVHRSRLGEFESWQRDPERPSSSDLYAPSLLLLDYDDRDRLDFIEVINAEAQVVYRNVSLLNMPRLQVLSELSALGHEPVGPIFGVYAYPELGIRLGFRFEDESPDDLVIYSVALVPEETDADIRRSSPR
ncbi:hypothetical protein OG563_07245 [Nocardia vinacea]|uniref:PIN domain-containing protein n=1 Tax=Nocardia vinacea TaxID=96468 RepID=A0ABZ1YXW2_9NOCA|nr:hypothetical protein [Nocardia vinacea]